MKLPIVWIGAAFATGVMVASGVVVPLAIPAAVTAVAITVGAVLVWRNRAAVAWACALVAWCALGTLASGIERGSVPANHVTRLIAAGKLDTSIALRWQGRLRSDPMLFPWDRRYEVDLERV